MTMCNEPYCTVREVVEYKMESDRERQWNRMHSTDDWFIPPADVMHKGTSRKKSVKSGSLLWVSAVIDKEQIRYRNS